MLFGKIVHLPNLLVIVLELSNKVLEILHAHATIRTQEPVE